MQVPIYKLTLSEDKKGLNILSLVDEPAIMEEWVKFNNQKEIETKFSIQDEEQRIIFGPVLIPDLPVYRNDKKRGSYYLTIEKETIVQFALNSSRDNKMNLYDVQHSEQPVDGVVMLEQVITDKKRFPHAVGFEHLPVGTLFRTSKVVNEDVWNRIKNRELNGYSIDAVFGIEPVEILDDKIIDSEIKNILK